MISVIETPIRTEYIPIVNIITDILKCRDRTVSPASENTYFNQNKGNLSVSFFNSTGSNVSLWVKVGKKSSSLEVKYSYYNQIPALATEIVVMSPNRHVKKAFYLPSEIYRYAEIILSIYDYRELESHGDLFSCCSRYDACSDAKYCIHPDREVSAACTYRLKLTQGIIFFGKNRNVD